MNDLTTILMRRSDSKLFYVERVGHWSDIHSLDGDDKDAVKLYGEHDGYEAYVGATSGQGYLLVQE